MKAQDKGFNWLNRELPLELPPRKITPLRIFLHVLFWIWYFWSIQSTMDRVMRYDLEKPPIPHVFWVATLNHIGTTMIGSYLLMTLVINKVMNILVYQRATGKIKWKHVAIMASVIVCTAFAYFVNDYFLFEYLMQFKPTPKYILRWFSVLGDAGLLSFFTNIDVFNFVYAYNFSYLIIILMLKAIREAIGWGLSSYQQGVRNQQINLEQIQQLHHQITPHFLFNNLNNIYAKVRKSNREAADMVMRLADLLRYPLYHIQHELVPLDGDLNFIHLYISMEQSSRMNPERIQIAVTGDPMPYQVPPLLLITFIENACKHGLDETDISGWVRIQIDIDNTLDKLHFVVENSKSTRPLIETVDSGIGLDNAQKRMKRFYEPDMFVFKQWETPTAYTVDLTMNLLPATTYA